MQKNYNIPFDVDDFARLAQRILDDVEDELGWMYETLHADGKTPVGNRRCIVSDEDGGFGYAATTGADGTLYLNPAPVGRLEVTTWPQRLAHLENRAPRQWLERRKILLGSVVVRAVSEVQEFELKLPARER